MRWSTNGAGRTEGTADSRPHSDVMRTPVTMPKWPAWLMAIVGAACAYPAISNEPPAKAAQELYQAHGHGPDWSAVIHYGRIDYAGDKGVRLSVLRPQPRSSFNGRR